MSYVCTKQSSGLREGKKCTKYVQNYLLGRDNKTAEVTYTQITIKPIVVRALKEEKHVYDRSTEMKETNSSYGTQRKTS